MKLLLTMIALLLPMVTMAQTTGTATNATLGTHYIMIEHKNPWVGEVWINYGPTEDQMTERYVITNPEAYVAELIEGFQIDTETEVGRVIPLLAEGTPFQMGQTVCLNSQVHLQDPETGESYGQSVVSAETHCIRLIAKPKAPKRTGIIRK